MNLRKATAVENGGGTDALAAFTIVRTGDTSGPLTVAFSLGGTATEGQDYSVSGTTATIPPGADRVTVIVKVMDDAKVEGDETVILTVEPAGSYQIGTPGTRTVTILDDDQASEPGFGTPGGA